MYRRNESDSKVRREVGSENRRNLLSQGGVDCRCGQQQHCVEPTIAAVSTSTKESTAPNCFVLWAQFNFFSQQIVILRDHLDYN